MKVEINNHEVVVAEDVTTLSQLLNQEGFSGVGQAVAVNNRVVPRTQWDSFAIEDGMKLTVIRAVCGG
jgi:sulfur carrier protein